MSPARIVKSAPLMPRVEPPLSVYLCGGRSGEVSIFDSVAMVCFHSYS